MKILIGITFIYVIARILPHMIRLLILGKWSKNNKSKTLLGKTFYIFTREIHFKLDKVIENQRKRFVVENADNVVPIKKHKKKFV